MNVGVLVLAALGVAVAVMVTGAASGRLPRNGFAGIRIPSTMASDEAWRAGHAAARIPSWVGAGVVVVAVIVMGVVHSVSPTAQVTVMLVVIVADVLGCTIAAGRGAKAASRAHGEQRPSGD